MTKEVIILGQNGESDPQAIEEMQKAVLNDLAKLTKDNLTRLRKRLNLNPKKVFNNPKTIKILYLALVKIPEFKQAIEMGHKLGLEEKDMGSTIVQAIFEWTREQGKG